MNMKMHIEWFLATGRLTLPFIDAFAAIAV
jgi:hypothetical protein